MRYTVPACAVPLLMGLLERLGAHPRRSGLVRALREFGCVERTLFTLAWLEMPELQRQTL